MRKDRGNPKEVGEAGPASGSEEFSNVFCTICGKKECISFSSFMKVSQGDAVNGKEICKILNRS